MSAPAKMVGRHCLGKFGNPGGLRGAREFREYVLLEKIVSFSSTLTRRVRSSHFPSETDVAFGEITVVMVCSV